jgi:cytidine deaminase
MSVEAIDALLAQKRASNDVLFVLRSSETAPLLAHWADSAAPHFALRRALARAVSRYAIPPISDFKVRAVQQFPVRQAKPTVFFFFFFFFFFFAFWCSQVGACVVSRDGTVYLGVNVEFGGQPLSTAIHAEQFAIVNAALHGASHLESLCANATPCGHCRQFCQELHGVAQMDFVVDDSGRAFRIAELLPLGFGPADLENHDNVLLAQANHRVDAHSPTDWSANPAGPVDALTATQRTQLELVGIDRYGSAYAPYSGATSSVALLFRGRDEAVGGFIVESCAFNPSMTPVRSAIVAAIMSNVQLNELVGALLVERADARVSHLAETKTLLLSIAPNVTLGVKLVTQQTLIPSALLSPAKRAQVLGKRK